jgi:hypothetical protein
MTHENMDVASPNTIGARLSALSTYSGTAPVTTEDRKGVILEQVHRKIVTLAPHVKTCTVTVDSDGLADFVFVLEATVAALEKCGYKCTGPDGSDRYKKRRGSDSYGILLTRQPPIDALMEGGVISTFLQLMRAAWNVSESDSRDDDTISTVACVCCAMYLYCWLAWGDDRTIDMTVASSVTSLWKCSTQYFERTDERSIQLLYMACVRLATCHISWFFDFFDASYVYLYTALAYVRYTTGISVDEHTQHTAFAFAATRPVVSRLGGIVICCSVYSAYSKIFVNRRRWMILISVSFIVPVFGFANDIVYETRHATDRVFVSVLLGGLSLGCIWLIPRMASALKRIFQEFRSTAPPPVHIGNAAVDL